MKALGKKTWLIPDCYYPSTSSPGEYVSHEAFCVLNTGDKKAVMNITLYFEDCDPITGFTAECGANRTHHVRLDKITNAVGEHIPQDKPYALLIESSENVVIQYSRLDCTQPELALMTTIAYS